MCVATKQVCSPFNSQAKGGAVETRGSSPRTHEFRAVFEGQLATFKVSSVLGHVFNLDFAPAYRDWDGCDPSELWEAPLVRVPTSGSVLKTLREEGKGCDVLILFLDCDREGEAIAQEVMNVVASEASQRVLRARFSAVTPRDIERAMLTLGEPDALAADAVGARQELDLRVGVAFTRFATRHFQGKYAGLDATTLSYGPCQTPTLGFVVRRCDEIANFQPEPFFVLEARATLSGETCDLEWQRGECFDLRVATAPTAPPACARVRVCCGKRTRERPFLVFAGARRWLRGGVFGRGRGLRGGLARGHAAAPLQHGGAAQGRERGAAPLAAPDHEARGTALPRRPATRAASFDSCALLDHESASSCVSSASRAG